MILLYAFGRVHPKVIGVTRDLRVEWTLEETGLPYKIVPLDHTGGELSGEAYSRISHFNQVPVIDDAGFVVNESGAILLYLAEKARKLIPDDFAGRTEVLEWCFAALTTVELPLAEIQMIDMLAEGTEDAKRRREWYVTWASQRLGDVERRLGGRMWITGADFTVADILLVTVLREVRHTDLLAPFPRVSDYFQRAQARPAWQRTIAVYAARHGVGVEEIR